MGAHTRSLNAPDVDVKPENQQTGLMKVTVDLPDHLIKKVKLRALHNQQKLKDAVQDLLLQGLSASTISRRKQKPRLVINPKTGLPEVDCGPGARKSTLSIEQNNELIRRLNEEQDLEKYGISSGR